MSDQVTGPTNGLGTIPPCLPLRTHRTGEIRARLFEKPAAQRFCVFVRSLAPNRLVASVILTN